MTQVIVPADGEAVGKSKWHSRITAEEDFITAKEVFAFKAHLFAFGEPGKRLEEVANEANVNELMSQEVTWKSVRDRYRRY